MGAGLWALVVERLEPVLNLSAQDFVAQVVRQVDVPELDLLLFLPRAHPEQRSCFELEAQRLVAVDLVLRPRLLSSLDDVEQGRHGVALGHFGNGVQAVDLRDCTCGVEVAR